MPQPKITVIIPVYNAERFITRAVESVIAQTFRDWELILVNDGSTDNSGNICDRLALTDRRIKVFHKGNGGAASARNFGLDHAGGDFICFIDADDQVKNSLLNNYATPPHNKSDLTVSGFQINFRKTTSIYNIPKSTLPINKFFDIVNDILLIGSSCNKMYRRDIIENNRLRFPTDISDVGEDHIFNWSYFQHCQMVSITGCVDYAYIENPDSLTHEKSATDPTSFAEKRLKLMDRLNGVMSDITDKGLRGVCQQIYHSYFSDTIVRPLYIHRTDTDGRRRILAGYKSELRKASYSRLKASHGIFSKMIDLFCCLPLPVADCMLKFLFGAKRLITHG